MKSLIGLPKMHQAGKSFVLGSVSGNPVCGNYYEITPNML